MSSARQPPKRKAAQKLHPAQAFALIIAQAAPRNRRAARQPRRLGTAAAPPAHGRRSHRNWPRAAPPAAHRAAPPGCGGSGCGRPRRAHAGQRTEAAAATLPAAGRKCRRPAAPCSRRGASASSSAGSRAVLSPYSTSPCNSNQSTPLETSTRNAPGRRKIFPSASMCQPASTSVRTTRGQLAGGDFPAGLTVPVVRRTELDA